MIGKTLSAIYVDFQNVKLTAHQAEHLVSFANQFGDLSNQKVYADWKIESKDSAEYFYALDFECLNVPSNKKNNVDNKLIADCELEISHIVFLVTGDGDFTNLVSSLKSKGKKVIVFCQLGKVNQKLRQSADAVYSVNKLPELVGNIGQINYNEAIQCLIQAIKLALKQSKPATYQIIDQLMRQNKQFPNYQGVSSIRKPDGKPFRQFSKFVEAVKADGKVQVRSIGKVKEVSLVEKSILVA
ncbi:MAG: NYN domain-containing protein [Coleofasciculaceae cyanobacterium]